MTSTRVLLGGQPVRAVLFDMDGVIADTRAAHAHSWSLYADSLGQPIDRDDFMRKTFGRGNMQVLLHFFPDREGDIPFLLEQSETKEAIFRDLFRRGEAPAVPGLLPFVEAMRARGVRLAVGSSAPHGNIDCVLEEWDLARHFDAIVGMEDVTHAKPDPEIFLKCLERLGVAAQDAIVLEDSLHGLDAAHRAGCRAVGFATMHPPEEIAPHSDIVVADFNELLSRLTLG